MMNVICSGFLVAHRRENMKCTIFPLGIIIVIITLASPIGNQFLYQTLTITFAHLFFHQLITMIIMIIFALDSLYVNIWREKKPTRGQA